MSTLRAVLTAGVLALACEALIAQQGASVPTEALYQKALDWPQLPAGTKLGFIVNAVPQPDHSVWILQRSNPPIMHLDREGRLLTSFGTGMFGHAHGMCITRDGSIWAGDSGDSLPTPRPSTIGSVFYKFNQRGEVLMTLGKPGVSAQGPDTFIAPTSCIEAPNGDIIIADGHVPRALNQDQGDRLMRFSPAGRFITAYGETGKGPGQFRGIHQLAYDSQGRLFVADNKNSRIQILDRAMKPVATWTAFGRPSMIFITPDDTLVSLDTESGLKHSWVDYPGDDPAAIRNPSASVGVRIGSAKTGVVERHFSPDPQVTGDMLAVDAAGDLYTRGAKWIKKTQTPPAASITPRYVDLTHDLSSDAIFWPTGETFQLTKVADGITDKGYYYASNSFSGNEHGGTHLDAPVHFAQGRWTVDQIPLDRLIGNAVVVDVSPASAANADYQVSVTDFTAWEQQHGPIAPDSIVLIRTDFAKRWPDARAYLGTEERGDAAVAKLHFPGLHPDAARWLVEKRVKAVGLDTASIDYGQSTLFESHRILYERNIPAFENLTGLDALPPRGATVYALPMKIRGGSGGPLRAIALIPG